MTDLPVNGLVVGWAEVYSKGNYNKINNHQKKKSWSADGEVEGRTEKQRKDVKGPDLFRQMQLSTYMLISPVDKMQQKP